MEFVWCFLMVKFILRILVRIAQNNVVLCRSLFCLLSSLWNNDGSCEERKIVWAHTGFHVSFTVFPNSCSLYNLRHNTRTWKLTWVPGGPVVLCHLSHVHICVTTAIRIQSCSITTKISPHAALFMVHSLPSGSLPWVFHPWQLLICPPSLSFCHLEEQHVDEFHSVWPL